MDSKHDPLKSKNNALMA